MEQRALIEYLREEGHESTQIHSQLVERYEARHSPILMSAIGRGSFVCGEKALKIRVAAEDRQISKLISESKEHSKHRLTFQFETLFRPRALLS
jgi:hypothetical protein